MKKIIFLVAAGVVFLGIGFFVASRFSQAPTQMSQTPPLNPLTAEGEAAKERANADAAAGKAAPPTGMSVATDVSQNISASPTSGPAPLTVSFNASIGRTYTKELQVSFGDGQNAIMNPGGCGPTPTSPCWLPNVNHTYTSPGTYTAILYGLSSGSSTQLGKITITIVGTTSVIIDRSSLFSSSGIPIITGTASGVNTLVVGYGPTIENGYSGEINLAVPVIGGRWTFKSGRTTPLPAGTYSVSVTAHNTVIATGTLTVTNSIGN